MSLLAWAKETIQKLIGKTEIENQTKISPAVSDEMEAAVALWSNMYQNCPPWKSCDTKTLNLPAVIAAKFARLVTLEAEVDFTGGARADWIAAQMAPVLNGLRNSVEFACAKGGLAFKPYPDMDRIQIDVIQADRFFPAAFDSNGDILAGIFVAQQVIGKRQYTRLEYHSFANGAYTITNQAFESSTAGLLGQRVPLSAVPEWTDIQPETTIEGLDHPLFAYFKIPLANNIDDASPLGVSVYARAAETIEQFDRQYSRLLWEFEGGELAVHASAEAFRQKPGGNPDEVYLENGPKRLYRLLDTDEAGKNLFEVYSPALRDTSLLNGMNALLRQIETQCGLAFGTLSDPQSVDKTATEVMQSKQESYSTVSDIRSSLEAALRRLAGSVDALGTVTGIAPPGGYEMAFDWGDAIITDNEARKAQFWQYVVAGKFPFWKFLTEFEGYTEEEARALQAESSRSMGAPYADAGIS